MSRSQQPPRPDHRGRAVKSGRSRTRTPWGTISRERVIGAALKVIEAGRYEQMTIRSLAAELNVAPMSLYRHVRNKDDLLDEVVDRLLARRWRPRAKAQDWQAWIAEAADRLRRFLVTQPAALHVYLAHPVVSPAAIARMEAMIGVLHEALGDEEEAKRAYGTIHTYTIGFAALEASRAHSTVGSHEGDEALARQLAGYTTSEQFMQGLRYLIEAIEHRAVALHDAQAAARIGDVRRRQSMPRRSAQAAGGAAP